MGVVEYKVPVATTGTAGSATGTNYSPPLYGHVLKVTAVPDGSAPNTTDATATVEGGSAEVLLTATNMTTAVSKNPREPVQDISGGADLTYDGTHKVYEPVPVGGRRIKCDVAQSDALSPAVTFYIVVKE